MAVLRALTRYRQKLIETRTSELQRLATVPGEAPRAFSGSVPFCYLAVGEHVRERMAFS